MGEAKRINDGRWRAANREKIRAKNRIYMREYSRRPEVRARKKNPDAREKRKVWRKAWLAIPENREKYRAQRREYKRRVREKAKADRAEAQRLAGVFELVWTRLLEMQRVTDCTDDRERLATVVLDIAQGATEDDHVLAQRIVESFCGGAT